jgi:hypothetical protein
VIDIARERETSSRRCADVFEAEHVLVDGLDERAGRDAATRRAA